MYYCKNCTGEFITAETVTETHGLPTPPYEEMLHCPLCGSNDYYEKTVKHCHCCGAKIIGGEGEYCSSTCRNKGERMWSEQIDKNRKMYVSEINKALREVEAYNEENRTNYSYGQFVAIVRPDMKRGRKH